MKLIRVGIDLAKQVFQVHGVDRSEKHVWRRRLRREEWINVVRERAEPGCEIGMDIVITSQCIHSHTNSSEIASPQISLASRRTPNLLDARNA